MSILVTAVAILLAIAQIRALVPQQYRRRGASVAAVFAVFSVWLWCFPVYAWYSPTLNGLWAVGVYAIGLVLTFAIAALLGAPAAAREFEADQREMEDRLAKGEDSGHIIRDQARRKVYDS